MIYYTSDLHIGHENAIRFDNRPFKDVETMENKIIENWNTKVLEKDDVYILGDIFLKYKKDKSEFLSKLAGKKHLVIGNHDKGLLSDKNAMKHFISVSQIENIFDNERLVVLCHYPLAEWYKSPYGSYHVYGHIHSKVYETSLYMLCLERAFNAGCMINGYTPCTLEELEENKRKFIMESMNKSPSQN